MYDSRKDTINHIEDVRHYLYKCISELFFRALVHDESKLQEPEKSIFDQYTTKLKETTYNSDEYKQYLDKMKIALNHHYANNSHHPEHYSNGIMGTNLIDVLEMLCDWRAAVKRHADGDILKSIEINQKRFNFSDELKAILINTLKVLE